LSKPIYKDKLQWEKSPKEEFYYLQLIKGISGSIAAHRMGSQLAYFSLETPRVASVIEVSDIKL